MTAKSSNSAAAWIHTACTHRGVLLGMAPHPDPVLIASDERESVTTCDTLRPYAVTPRGLNTFRAAIAINISKPTPAWSSSPRKAGPKIVATAGIAASAAIAEKELTVDMCCSKTAVATMVKNSEVAPNSAETTPTACSVRYRPQ